jgi:tetratricopeptide (TPR) repeat protein
MWTVYLEERRLHARSVAFFIDAAEAFIERGRRAEGLRALSNLAEMDLQNRQVLRLLAYRLQQADESELAAATFQRVLELAPHEPQSSRDLGLALAATKQPQAAIEALYAVATGSWDARFPDIDLIALVELNAIVDAQTREGRSLDLRRVDARLLRPMPLDLRVVLAWDADDTDVDLHVVDPNGEEVYYGHARSRQGGAITRDATGGYGPEEFALRVAKPGRYRIEAQFYGHRQQVLLSSTGLMLWLSSGWATPRQEDRRTTLRLQSTSGARVVIGTFDVPA